MLKMVASQLKWRTWDSGPEASQLAPQARSGQGFVGGIRRSHPTPPSMHLPASPPTLTPHNPQ